SFHRHSIMVRVVSKMTRRTIQSALSLVSGGFLFLSALSFPLSARSDNYAKTSPSGWVEDDGPPAAVVTRDKSGKMILQGGVKHSVDLPSLPSALKAGSFFDEKALPKPPHDDQWYLIPDWLAGRWLRSEETILSTYRFDTHTQNNQPRTIALQEMADFGVQRDSAGHIWHYRLATRGMADKGSTLSIALVQSQEPLSVTDQEVVIRDVFTELQVNRATSVIIEAKQAESISHYLPVKDGTIRTSVSIKFFQEDGTPDRQQENVSTERRIEAFSPCNSYKGLDLKKSFADYLRASGKASLIP
ncbi:MAG TPA: hypothetical protein V6C72_03600, partial [Chroococcales cyanobacterium]